MTALLRTLHAAAPGFAAELASLRARGSEPGAVIEATVREIIAAVRRDGDAALVDYTRRFDRHDIANAGELELPAARLAGALRELEPAIRAALEHAADRVRTFHGHQREASWQFEEADGTRLGQRITPLDRVGIYVPGGTAAYPSSVLMNAIPARVAGVGELVMVTPAPAGAVNPAVLAAAALVGVDRVFTVGGAQAVAALAYGTPTLPRVDKIVGPGNIYVATAKRMVFGQVGIDMVAGPSEVVVICDATVDPQWVAMDLLAQAEHDELAQAIAISTDGAVLAAVRAALERLLPAMPRRAVIASALRDHGALIEARSLDDAIVIANDIAPEHLELLVADPAPLIARISHAGAIFAGRYSAEALGDYCAGPNHVLPTAGTARFSSPLGVYDFIKRSSVIQCSPAGAAHLADTAAALARSEGLVAHARAAEVRRQIP